MEAVELPDKGLEVRLSNLYALSDAKGRGRAKLPAESQQLYSSPFYIAASSYGSGFEVRSRFAMDD